MADVLKLETYQDSFAEFLRQHLRDAAELSAEDLRDAILLLPSKNRIVSAGQDRLLELGVLAWWQFVLGKETQGDDG